MLTTKQVVKYAKQKKKTATATDNIFLESVIHYADAAQSLAEDLDILKNHYGHQAEVILRLKKGK